MFLLLLLSGQLLAQSDSENGGSEHLTDGTTLVKVQASEQKKEKKEGSGELAKTLEKGLKEAKKKEAIADQLTANEKGEKQGDLNAKEKKALEKLGKGMKGHHENNELGNVEYSRN